MIGYIIVFTFEFLICLLAAISMVKGGDWMNENYPDYKGDDFLDLGDNNGKKP